MYYYKSPYYIDYVYILTVKCGGSFFDSQGSFTSPGYPGNYSPNMNCNFTITAPVGNKVKQDAFIILPNY